MEDKKVENLNEQKTEKVNDQELENVSGSWIIADWFESNMKYESGEFPKFKVGDRIVHTVYGGDRHKGTVIEVSTGKSGMLYREFTYTVRHDEDGYVDKGVYESSLALSHR